MLDYIFTEDAFADMIKHALKYEEKQIGLGTRFMDAAEHAAVELANSPRGFESRYKSTRERK
jgi:hypothetical protein